MNANIFQILCCIVIQLNSKLIFIYEQEGYSKIPLQSINNDFSILEYFLRLIINLYFLHKCEKY